MYHGMLVDVRGQLVELDLTYLCVDLHEAMSLGSEVSIFYYSLLFHWPIGTNFLCCFSVFLRKISLFFISLPPFSLFFLLFSSVCASVFLCLYM